MEHIVIGTVALATIGILAYVVIQLLNALKTTVAMVKANGPREFQQLMEKPDLTPLSEPEEEQFTDLSSVDPEMLSKATIVRG